MSSSVQIDDKGFREKFKKFYATARNPRGLLAVMGREAANRLRTWFRWKDDSDPNKLGGERQHFWLAVGRSVQQPVINEAEPSVEISINDPRFARKVFGGPISAKRTKFLAIPVTAESYGRRPRVFQAETGHKLFFLGDSSGGELVEAQPTADGELITRYLLKPSVFQEPDADALPDLTENGPFLQGVLARAESYLQRELNAPGNQAPSPA